MFAWWVENVRWGYLMYGLVVVTLVALFGRWGELPRQLIRLIRGAALLWPAAYFYMLQDIPGLKAADYFFGAVFPTVCAFVLPELVQLVMQILYHRFGPPTHIRKMQRQIQKAQLEHTLIRRTKNSA